MLTIIGIIFPVFAMIGIGYLAVHVRLCRKTDLDVFGRFVVNISLPALLFGAVSGFDLSANFQPSYLFVYAACGLGTIALVFVLLSYLDVGAGRRAVATMGAACPNSAYIGYPILALTYPNIAGQAFAMNLVVENFLLFPLCLVLLQRGNSDLDQPWYRQFVAILWQVVRRPMILALIAAIVVSAFQIRIPDPMSRLVTLIGSATPAIALFFVGGSLVGIPIRGNLRIATHIVIAKLVTFPLLAWLAGIAFATFGLGLADPDLRAALILSAAMPMMAMYGVFAQDVGHEGMASMALLGAVVGSAFSLTAILSFQLG